MVIGKTTLDDFLAKHQVAHTKNNPGLRVILGALAAGAKEIAGKLRFGGSRGLGETTGQTNVSGDAVTTIDSWAHRVFIARLLETNEAAFVFSEEAENAVMGLPKAKNLICLDLFDGSSLADSNITVGSIFSVYQRTPDHPYFSDRSCFLNLHDQVCAGYGLYGPATLLVLAFEDGIYEFVLSVSGEFVLFGEKIKLPASGKKIYSINEGHSAGWDFKLAGFIQHLKQSGYSSRYVGALVADFHRTLKEGGIFIYPATTKHPFGKLRLFYEAGPLAFIMERAGGFALVSPGQQILDVKADNIHYRTPFIFGHSQELEVLKSFF